MKKLPNKLSSLIRLAVKDLISVEKSRNYRVKMNKDLRIWCGKNQAIVIENLAKLLIDHFGLENPSAHRNINSDSTYIHCFTRGQDKKLQVGDFSKEYLCGTSKCIGPQDVFIDISCVTTPRIIYEAEKIYIKEGNTMNNKELRVFFGKDKKYLIDAIINYCKEKYPCISFCPPITTNLTYLHFRVSENDRTIQAASFDYDYLKDVYPNDILINTSTHSLDFIADSIDEVFGGLYIGKHAVTEVEGGIKVGCEKVTDDQIKKIYNMRFNNGKNI